LGFFASETPATEFVIALLRYADAAWSLNSRALAAKY
jgi:hypothetical protein